MTTIETHTQATNGKLAHTSSLVPFSELSEKLAMLRNKLGLSQREMGELLGVSHGCISLWERGHPPHGPNMAMLRKFLNQNWSEVMGRGQGLKQAEPTTPAPEFQFVDPDATDEVILPRQDQLALRFKGKRLGSLVASSDLTIVLYLTVGGKVVWWVSPTAMHGDVQDFLRWVQDHSKASERVKKDIITYAASVGLQIFEDIE